MQAAGRPGGLHAAVQAGGPGDGARRAGPPLLRQRPGRRRPGAVLGHFAAVLTRRRRRALGAQPPARPAPASAPLARAPQGASALLRGALARVLRYGRRRDNVGKPGRGRDALRACTPGSAQRRRPPGRCRGRCQLLVSRLANQAAALRRHSFLPFIMSSRLRRIGLPAVRPFLFFSFLVRLPPLFTALPPA